MKDTLEKVVQNHSQNSNAPKTMNAEKMQLIKQVPVIMVNVNVRKEEKEKIAMLNKSVFV